MARTSERGFGIVEIIVVLLIIAIVGAIAFASVGNTRSNAATRTARAAAEALGEGVEQFQRDHGGRLPAQPGTVPAGQAQSDWNAAWTSPVDASNRRGTTPQPYVTAGSIQALTDRSAAVERSNGTVKEGLASTNVRIRYSANYTRGLYAFVVRSRKGTVWKSHCYATNADRGTTAGRAFLQPHVAAIGGARAC
ncbi:MAG: prepilin-type N-terminal cleavage/methylation domain-containing protein [Gaiellales bacterium]